MLGITGRPANSHRPFLTERPKELFLGSARVILAPARLTRQESLLPPQNCDSYSFYQSPGKPLPARLRRATSPAGGGRPPRGGGCHGCAMTGGVSFFTLHSSLPFRGAKGDDNRRWRSGANRPNQRMRRGWAPSGLPCAAKNRAAAGYGSPALHFRLEIRTPKILPPPGRR